MFSTGTISLIADSMSLSTAGSSQVGGTAVDTGSATLVVISAFTPGTSIGIAGAAGALSLTANELNTIYATNVRIGNSSAGDVTVGSWKPHANVASNGVITLDTAATITQTGVIDLSLDSAGLLLRDATSVDLSTNSGAGNVFSSIAG